MRHILATLSLALAASGALAADPIRLSCTRETDTFAGYALFNPDLNRITIEATTWNVSVDNGSGIVSSGSLGVAGPYVRLNRLNGVIMARWKPTTPAGSLDMAGVCDVIARRF